MKMKQTDRIVAYINEFGSITTHEAFMDIGVTRLASRVHDLRSAGVPIVGKTETARNRYGEPVSYKRYSLEKTSENNTSVSAPQ